MNVNAAGKSQSASLTKRVRLAGIVTNYLKRYVMKAILLWPLWNAFKFCLLLTIVLGIGIVMMLLYLKDRLTFKKPA